ncbi:MAG: hypothetical protein ACTSW7_00790 [Candidatus Thorarchaeota archaeon]|nr:hypothetical protein [Thermoplasmatales archaeon]
MFKHTQKGNKHIIEYTIECSACKGTGIYCGFAEKDGIGVVCHSCDGEGEIKTTEEFTESRYFKRKNRKGIKLVLQYNPGMIVGVNEKLSYEDWGGMSYEEWKKKGKFPPKSEMRKYICPAWWYQNIDYKKKPDWNECGFGAFSDCKHFKNKAACWKRWDKEQR